ncbi:hypothetical protein [Stieleria sp. JC731]|nr:hypothetical protein [Stieleria sp. JC731]
MKDSLVAKDVSLSLRAEEHKTPGRNAAPRRVIQSGKLIHRNQVTGSQP